MLLQQRGGTDARQLQDFGRVHSTCGQRHFARCGYIHDLALVIDLRAGAARAAIVAILERQLDHLRFGPDGQVGARFGGAEKCLGRVPAPTRALVHIKVPDARVVAAVEVVRLLNAVLFGSIGKAVQHIPTQALFFDAPFAAVTVHVGKTAVVARFGVSAVVQFVVIFVDLEIGQRIRPAPIVFTGLVCPTVIIPRLSAHIDHAVDRRTAAQCFTTRIAQRAPVQALVRFGVIEPVGARIADAVQIPHGDVHPRIRVGFASL